MGKAAQCLLLAAAGTAVNKVCNVLQKGVDTCALIKANLVFVTFFLGVQLAHFSGNFSDVCN